MTGLLGPNGAGKTTLLRLLATALPPSQGQVSVLGLDPGVPAQRTGIRRQLGYQPQQVGFPRGFTAFAFVDYIALLKEWTEPAARHAEVRRVLALVGLSGLGAKRIRAMSGGQRRRVALAQALLGSPPVLILDEPTTGVDPEQRVVLRAVLAEIARTSVVELSTHQTEDVAALCERVIVLDGGRVRYYGPLASLTGQELPGLAGRRAGPRRDHLLATGTGRYRNIGARVRDGAEHAEPSLKTPTCCCAAGHQNPRPPGTCRHDRSAHARPAQPAPAGHAHPARRPGDTPVRPQPGLPVRRGVHGVRAMGRPGDRANRDRHLQPVPGDLLRRVRHDGHVLADPVDCAPASPSPALPRQLPAAPPRCARSRSVPFACGCLALLRFVQLIPASNPIYGRFSPSAPVAVLVGQISAQRLAARRL